MADEILDQDAAELAEQPEVAATESTESTNGAADGLPADVGATKSTASTDAAKGDSFAASADDGAAEPAPTEATEAAGADAAAVLDANESAANTSGTEAAAPEAAPAADAPTAGAPQQEAPAQAPAPDAFDNFGGVDGEAKPEEGATAPEGTAVTPEGAPADDAANTTSSPSASDEGAELPFNSAGMAQLGTQGHNSGAPIEHPAPAPVPMPIDPTTGLPLLDEDHEQVTGGLAKGDSVDVPLSPVAQKAQDALGSTGSSSSTGSTGTDAGAAIEGGQDFTGDALPGDANEGHQCGAGDLQDFVADKFDDLFDRLAKLEHLLRKLTHRHH